MKNWKLSFLFRVLLILQSLVLVGELLLIGHFEGWQQTLPIVALGIFATAFVSITYKARAIPTRVYRLVLLTVVLVGLAGCYFHLNGNMEFEKELYPGMTGFELFWNSARGATPILAPLSLSGLGLFGLLYIEFDKQENKSK